MKFKTITNATVKSINGEMRVLSEKDGLKQKVELWLLNEDVNRNDWQFLNIEEHKKLFAETPILVAYVGSQIGDGHNMTEWVDENGDYKASFMAATAERIVGYFRDEEDIRIAEKDGKKWIVGTGYIWTWYAQELVAKLREQGREGMSVSIETLIDEAHKNGRTEVYTKYRILGTTILGDDVVPAVAGASIRALSALGIDNIRTLTNKVVTQNLKQTENNPRKMQKEQKTTMNIKDLKGKFEGFNVLAVNGDKVAMLSAKGEAFVASVSKDEATGELVEGAKFAVNATVSFGDDFEVALNSITEEAQSKMATLSADLAKKTEECETVTNALKKMQMQETARRKEAVKAAVLARLQEVKENSGICVENDFCADLTTEEKLAEYAEMEDKDGKFVGEEQARCDVDARCMKAIIDHNKAENKKKTAMLSWEKEIERDADKTDDLDVSIQNILA